MQRKRLGVHLSWPQPSSWHIAQLFSLTLRANVHAHLLLELEHLSLEILSNSMAHRLSCIAVRLLVWLMRLCLNLLAFFITLWPSLKPKAMGQHRAMVTAFTVSTTGKTAPHRTLGYLTSDSQGLFAGVSVTSRAAWCPCTPQPHLYGAPSTPVALSSSFIKFCHSSFTLSC